MRTLRHVGDLRAVLAPVRSAGIRRRAGSPSRRATIAGVGGKKPPMTIGLVPTMGALHEGHLSLIRLAREQCDVVVVSLFVNPSQFDEHSDLERYPRNERDDAALAARAGADLLFAPSIEEVYPPGFATAVEVLGITDRFEGACRGAAHFRGVATVVTKLLCMVQPDVAYLGAKDAQQVLVIRRLIADLNLPVAIEVGPTVREPDGLAMSSRNALLDPASRERARALFAALNAASLRASAGERSMRALIGAAEDTLARSGVRPEYLALVDPAEFEPLEELDRPALLVLAARVGRVRLIDNVPMEPAGANGAAMGPIAAGAGRATAPAREEEPAACSA
jgi:pantoate--beta-alanine ligase